MKMEYIFRMMREFESTANPNTFKKIFDEGSTHLWNLFSSKCDSNLIRFSRVLDSENHNKLMNYFDFPMQKSFETLNTTKKSKQYERQY
jgi:hypothetical protein